MPGEREGYWEERKRPIPALLFILAHNGQFEERCISMIMMHKSWLQDVNIASGKYCRGDLVLCCVHNILSGSLTADVDGKASLLTPFLSKGIFYNQHVCITVLLENCGMYVALSDVKLMILHSFFYCYLLRDTIEMASAD